MASVALALVLHDPCLTAPIVGAITSHARTGEFAPPATGGSRAHSARVIEMTP
jgi:hypothetical protein